MSWAGRLLVATPALDEPAFARAVVLLLNHDHAGALGVVVNRPSGTSVATVLPAWDGLMAVPDVVHVGGPVQPEAAICLGDARPGAGGPFLALLGATSFATVDLDAPPEQVCPQVRALRVFAGYAGWSAGQLEGEVDEGAWWVVDAFPGDAFSACPTLLWRQVLRRQGGRLAMVSTLPDDVAQN